MGIGTDGYQMSAAQVHPVSIGWAQEFEPKDMGLNTAKSSINQMDFPYK
jgi:hypothetical protein